MDSVLEWDWADIIYFLVTLMTGFGVWAIGLQIIGERSARHREFENMYVQRYWDIAAKLPMRFVQGFSDYKLSKPERTAMYNYLLLCEDEMDLRAKGFITDKTWKIWMSGIFSAVTDPQIKKLIEGFPAGRLEHLRMFAYAPNPSFDPLKYRWPRRWWTGLR